MSDTVGPFDDLGYGSLYDAGTNKPIGPATRAQAEASEATSSGPEYAGIILIDADGTVVKTNSWESQQPGVRRVWVGA